MNDRFVAILGLLVLCIGTVRGQTNQIKLKSSDLEGKDRFGVAVSMDGDYAVVGATLADYWVGAARVRFNAGAAYIFSRIGEEWSEQAKLTAGSEDDGHLFGSSVSISGDYVIVGESGANDKGASSGSAFIFVRDGEAWTEQAKLTASDGDVGGSFGASVSISGDYVRVH